MSNLLMYNRLNLNNPRFLDNVDIAYDYSEYLKYNYLTYHLFL